MKYTKQVAGGLRYLGWLCGICVVCACKKEGIRTYDNKANKPAIYFAEAKSLENAKTISFGYAKTTVKDSVVSFIINTIGAPEKNDRPYKLVLADSSTLKPETDFQILNSSMIIKAGSVADTLKIKLIRTTKLRTTPLRLYMELQPNDSFSNDYLSYISTNNGVSTTKYYTRMVLNVDDIAGAPPFWLPTSPYYSYVIGYLGTFSMLKMQLFITYYNLDVNEVVAPNWFTNNNNGRRIIGWANGLQAYLARMAAAGTPVYEADGKTLMSMGPYVK